MVFVLLLLLGCPVRSPEPLTPPDAPLPMHPRIPPVAPPEGEGDPATTRIWYDHAHPTEGRAWAEQSS